MNSNWHIVKKLDDFQHIDISKKYIFDIDALNLEPEQLFIAIRNLELSDDNFKLSISNNLKEKWLLTYIKTNISININQFNNIWNEYFIKFLSNEYNIFIDCNKDLFVDIKNFLYSLIYFATTIINIKDVFKPVCNKISLFGINIFNIFKSLDNIDFRLLKINNCIQYNYDNIFIDKNYYDILSIAKTSKVFLMLYGKTTKQWNIFKELITKIYG